MTDEVKIPVKLVTDLDLSKVDVSEVTKTIEAKLSGLGKSIGQVFSKVDTTKATKPLLTSMIALENSFGRVVKAQREFQQEADRTGKSTASYKNTVTELDEAKVKLEKLAEIRSNWEDESGNYKGTESMWSTYIESCEKYEAQLYKVRDLQTKVNNPSQFVKDADPFNQEKVESSYRKLVSMVSSFNKEYQKFNITAENNQTTQQYQDMEKEATRLVNKLQEYNEKSKEMANSTYTTDRQWEKLQSDTKKTSSELDSILRKMRQLVKEGNALAIGDDSSGLTSQIKSMDATRRGIAGYGKQVGSVDARANANMNPYTAEYQEELKNFQKLEQAVDKLNAKFKELQALHKLSPDSLAKLKYEATQLQGQLDASKNKLTEMVNNGSAFRLGKGDTNSELSGINSRLTDTDSKLQEITSETRTWSKATRGAKSGIVIISEEILKLSKRIFGAGKNFKLFGKQGSSTTSALSKGFNKLKRNVLMYGLGFRTAYYAIKRLRTLFIKEFQLMAQSSGEINTQISGLVMAFNRLKGSLAVAFQPLAAVIIPVLKTAMNYLTSLLEAIGKFNATLTGQGYIYKAVAKNIDYAADSVKNANKQLASYDKLEVINKDESDSNNDLGITYEKQDIEGAASNFAKLVKDAWAKQDFTEVGTTIGNKLVSALNSIPWNNIRKKAKGIANSIATLINGFFATEGLGESIGNTLANAILTAIDFMYTAFTKIDYKKIGKTISDVVNAFLTKMAEVDETGLSGWGKLAASISSLGTGILELITTAMETVDWFKVGQAIGDFISNIDWSKIIWDFVKLAEAILSGIAQALLGWAGEEPISAAIATIIGGILVSSAVIKKVNDIKTFLDKLPKLSGAKGASETAAETATEIESTSSGISTLTSKLTTLIKNLALGLVVIAEVAVAAGLIIAAIWGLGVLLEQVGKAWQPVIDNGETVLTAVVLGTAILVSVGVVTAALGTAGTPLIVAIALGIAVLAELGIAAGLFILEIIAIGMGLEQIGLAWQPVLDNGDTIKLGIQTGTDLLVAIGVVTAALGVATVASVGLLPIAIGLGTAMLVKLGAAFVVFCDELIKVANKLQELAPVLSGLNAILPTLKTDMDSYTAFMGDFALAVVQFTLTNAIAGIAATIDKVISFFTTDPVKRMYNEVTDQTKEFNKLIPALQKINPLIKQATKLVGEYKENMGSFEKATGGSGGFLGSIVKGAKGVVNGLIGLFEGMVNGVIKCINFLVGALNKVSFDVPDWVPAIGGKKFGFDIKKVSEVKIPRLAQGAVIPPNREFLAMLGDQKSGTNIEAPLETIKQAVAEVLAQMGGVGKPADVNLILAGKQVAKVVWDETEKKYKQTGKYSPAY